MAGERRAGQQFPGARLRREEGRRGLVGRQVEVGDEGQQAEQCDQPGWP
nr:hypothetical protein [Massilia sp. BJB1822]